MKLRDLLAYAKNRDFGIFDSVYIQMGENDLPGLTVGETMAQMLGIEEELRRQGVRRIIFGQVFLRRDRNANKRIAKFNKMMKKAYPDMFWDHGDLVSKDSISDDHLHLREDLYGDFQSSIHQALLA